MAWSERKSHSFAYALRNEFGVLAVDELRLGSKGSSSQLMLRLSLETHTEDLHLFNFASGSCLAIELLSFALEHSLSLSLFTHSLVLSSSD